MLPMFVALKQSGFRSCISCFGTNVEQAATPQLP